MSVYRNRPGKTKHSGTRTIDQPQGYKPPVKTKIVGDENIPSGCAVMFLPFLYFLSML